MNQDVVNIVFGLTTVLASFLLGAFWVMLREAQKEIQALHVVVVGKYVTTEVLDKSLGAVFAKLDRIENVMYNKVSNP